MTAPKLTLVEEVIAKAAATPFGRVNIGRLMRRTVYNIGVSVVFALAALQLDGWLAGAMWALLVLRLLPFAAGGLAQKILDERMARLDLLMPLDRQIITSTDRLARHFALTQTTRTGVTTRTVSR